MTRDELEKLLQGWIRQRFLLTEAREDDFPLFDQIFRRQLEEVREEHGVDPVTDHDTMVDDDEPEFGTCRQSVEKYSDKIFGFYLSARSKGHGREYAVAYSEDWATDDEERMAASAYRRLSEGHTESPENPAYIEAQAMCRHLGHDKEYAAMCANWMFDFEYSFQRANEVTVAELEALKVAAQRNYSPLRARMYADALGPKHSWLEEPLAELLARIFEEEVAEGRTEHDAGRYAAYYTECFDSDGVCDLDEEEMFADHAMVKAEAMNRHRYQDGDQSSFVDLFEMLNQGFPDNPEQHRFSRFDEVEKKLRQEWYLADPEPPSTRRRWKKHKPHQ